MPKPSPGEALDCGADGANGRDRTSREPSPLTVRPFRAPAPESMGEDRRRKQEESDGEDARDA